MNTFAHKNHRKGQNHKWPDFNRYLKQELYITVETYNKRTELALRNTYPPIYDLSSLKQYDTVIINT